jgi:hypothetical protein
MSHEIMKSELFVELSEQEEELIAGGCGQSKRPLALGPVPFAPVPFGPPPFAPGGIKKGNGVKMPFGPGSLKEGLGDKGFDGFPFNNSDE